MRPRYQSTISGKLLGLILGFCFLASALALPAAAHLPHWVEFELVLAVWWVIWWIVLAYVIYGNHEVETDVEVHRSDRVKNLPWSWAGGDGCLILIPEGCALFVVALVIISAALLLVEFLIPALFLLLVLSVRGMLKQAVTRHQGCEGRLPSSILWGALWATVYTAPVAGGVALIQRLLESR